MPEELRFTDPAFSCEVLIRGAHVALYRAAHWQFERLKEIRDLGLSGHFEDTGVHTKHHHLVGLMRLFEKLLVQPEGYGFPKKFLWSFWPRLCYGQTGHAAFCYDTEKAVLLACHVDGAFRRRLVEFLKPVIDEGANCIPGQNTDEKKAIVSQWLEELIERNKWGRLFYWVATLKLIQDQNLRGVLENQHYDKKSNKPGFDWATAILILIDPNSDWDKPIRRLHQLDYVVRDLHLTGRIGIILDVDRLVANVNLPEDPDWLLIRQLDYYLVNNLYEAANRQTESAIFQRTIAQILINKKISLTNIFGTDPQNYLSDAEFIQVVRKRKQGSELFDLGVRQYWKTWVIRGAVNKDRPPLFLERKLSGRRKGNTLLNDPSCKRIIAHQLTQPHRIALSIRHRDASDRPTPSAFIQACKKVAEVMYPSYEILDVHKAMLEGLFGSDIKHNLHEVVVDLSNIELADYRGLGAVAKYVVKHSSKTGLVEEDVKIVIAGVEQPLDRTGIVMPLRIMQAALSGSDDQRRKLGMSIENARQMLWTYLFQWQERFFQKAPVQSLRTLNKAMQEALYARIMAGEETKGKDLELYILLESLKHPNENVRFRISLPNVILLKPDGQADNEYDVISIVLKKDNTVETWIWGATTEKNYNQKRRSDLDKMQILKDKIGQRWSGEVRTPIGYVHVENNQLKLEYDGTQESR